MAKIRDYFPGNNTSEGFFSYYKYILGQEEADKIICIKGGPGTGKSTFIDKIGRTFADYGDDVDFLHCSADSNSLDGVILKNRNIAFIDGTSPHITDPITPGAVDSIVDFGQFWNEEAIIKNKKKIIEYSKESSKWYGIVYDYLAAAGKIYSSISRLVTETVEESDIYKVGRVIVRKEMGEYDFALKYGTVKKYFASAITPSGNVNYIKSLASSEEKVYLINTPLGYENNCLMKMIVDNAIGKGLDVECFYCPMNPRQKIEHIVIPDLNLAFITGNKWHDVEPWEIYDNEDDNHEIVMIDINDFTNKYYIEKNTDLLDTLSIEYEKLINSAINGLKKAKENHDLVEKYYKENMNFDMVNKLITETINKIKG